VSALEKESNQSQSEQPTEQVGNFLESYIVTSDFVALQAIHSMLKKVERERGRVIQKPGAVLDDGTRIIEVWA